MSIKLTLSGICMNGKSGEIAFLSILFRGEVFDFELTFA